MRTLNLAISCFTLLTSAVIQASVIDLSGMGYVQYGDGQSYSLPISQIQDDCTSPGCPYHVSSTPGQIKDLIVVATGAAGADVNSNFAGMDDAYTTPSGESGSNFFSTGTVADPTAEPDFVGDADATWDATLASLMSFLNGDDMVFMFNNNNLNGANLQSLAAWMQITLTDDQGQVFKTYDFTNDNNPYALISEGGGGTFMGDVTSYTSDGSGPDGNTNSDTDYVLSGGPLCINTDTPVPIPVPCDGSGILPVSEGPINHNLGADEVAYAVLFPELNLELADLFSSLTVEELGLYTLNIDLRLGCDESLFSATAEDELCTGEVSGFGKNLNNGYEQLFISTATPPVQATEPKPSWLVLTTLALLIIIAIKKHQKQFNLK